MVKNDFAQKNRNLSWNEYIKYVYTCNTFPGAFKIMMNKIKKNPLKDYHKGSVCLYESISNISGSDVVVDSTRNPFIAYYLLKNYPSAKVLFLTRNGEDSLYSKLQRMKSGRGFSWYTKHWEEPRWYIPFLLLNGISWVIGNLLSEVVAMRFYKRVLHIRYEDLCLNTSLVLSKIGSFIDIDIDPVILSIKNRRFLQINHDIGGNKMRHNREFIFKPEMNKPLPYKYKIIFRSFAWPLMLRYGYFSRIRREGLLKKV
jgi:hypothetical protein